MTHTEELAAPLVGRDDGQLQDPAGRARSRRRAPRSGTSTAASTPTCSAASRRRSWATRTRGWSRRSPRRPHSSATSPTWRCTSPASRWPSGCSSCAGRPGRVFFCNCGTEANEAALKISPAHRPARGRRGRGRLPRPVHGRALAHRPAGEAASRSRRSRRAWATCPTATPTPCAPPSTSGPRWCSWSRRWARAACVPPPPATWPPARRDLRATGALFVLDEVQTGIGRTGPWFAHQADGVQPDVITLAKGLGGGLPIGAMLAFGAAADLLTAGAHGSTFGGNPIAAAAALAVLDTIRDEGLLDQRQGRRPASPPASRRSAPAARAVRGRGALLASCSPATSPAGGGRRRGTPVPDQRRRSRTCSGSPRRWCSPMRRSDAFLSALPAALDTAGGDS